MTTDLDRINAQLDRIDAHAAAIKSDLDRLIVELRRSNRRTPTPPVTPPQRAPRNYGWAIVCIAAAGMWALSLLAALNSTIVR